MTQGLLNSSLNKSKLLRTKIRNPTENNIKKNKYVCKMFNKLKRVAKSKHYTDIFYMNVSNVKRTWQILHEVLNRQPNQNKQNELFVIGNIETNNKKDIANGFNTLFTNIGEIKSKRATVACAQCASRTEAPSNGLRKCHRLERTNERTDEPT